MVCRFFERSLLRFEAFLAGNLALSRALGDFEFKKNYSLSPEEQAITADPEITCHETTDEDEFLVIACDGMTSVTFFRTKLSCTLRNLGLSEFSTSYRHCAVSGF